MAEISWIKLKTTMFDDEKIRLIQAVPESDAILVIWIRLLVLAGKTNDDGLIYIQRNMPYTEEMLATLFGKNVNTIRLALNTLESFNMIDLGKDGLIAITNWEKHQNVEGMDKIRLQNAERNRRYRERKKQLALENSDVSVTSRDGTDIDKELDKELDKDISSGKAEPPIPYEEIMNYFNSKTKKNLKHTTGKTRALIKARWNEGFRLDDFKKVIDNKCFDWLVPGKKFSNGTLTSTYVRPSTIFGPKFEEYLNENQVKGASQRDTSEYDNFF